MLRRPRATADRPLPIQRVKWEEKIDYKPGDLIYGRGPYYGDARNAINKKFQGLDLEGYKTTVQSFIDRMMPDEDSQTYEMLGQEAKAKDDDAFMKFFLENTKAGKRLIGPLSRHDKAVLRQVCKAGI